MVSSVALLMVATCKAFHHMASSKHERVASALQLWREVHGPLQDALGLEKEIQQNFPVIDSVDAAIGRLLIVMEKDFIGLAKECVQKFGASDIKGALNYLNSSLDLTKNSPTFMSKSTSGLRVVSSCDDSVLGASIPAEVGDLQQHLPTYSKISYADFSLFKELLPEKIEKLENYTKQFQTSLSKWLSKIQKMLRDNEAVLDQFRPVIILQFHAFMPSCPTFLSRPSFHTICKSSTQR